MSQPTFFSHEYESGQKQVELNSQEAAHASKARRLKVGSEVQLLNGKGLMARGSISSIDRRSMIVEVKEERLCQANSFEVSIAFAIPKGDRQRTLVDMLTQLGVQRLIPLNCDRSITKFSDKMQSKFTRYAIEACKQSQNPWMPQIGEAMTVDQLIEEFNDKADICYADMHADVYLGEKASCDSFVMIVGPEGGFSEREFDVLGDSNAQSVKLASAILRTETAAVTAAAQIIASHG